MNQLNLENWIFFIRSPNQSINKNVPLCFVCGFRLDTMRCLLTLMSYSTQAWLHSCAEPN